MNTHTCHAHECPRVVPPRMFMCRTHWFALPRRLRDAIWKEYRPGQENDKNPSLRYLAVQQQAIGELAFKPNDDEAARISAPYLIKAQWARQNAIDAGQGDPLSWMPPIPEDHARTLRSLNRA